MQSPNTLRQVAIASFLGAMSTYPAYGQVPDSSPEPAFVDYAIIQFATTNGPGPQNILHLDNNGAVVLAARRPSTRQQLQAVAPHTDSQIALLYAYRLIEERGDTLQTAFPVLGPADTRRLRERTKAVAPILAEDLAPDVGGFVSQLQTVDRDGTAFTMLFSYVLDGLVWTHFEDRSLVNTRVIAPDTPFWAGEIWAVYPPRTFAPGTNSIAEEGIAIKVNWSEETIPHMLPFIADFPTLIRLFEDYKETGRVQDAHVLDVFGPFDVFDDQGRITVPVVVESKTNALYVAADAIARDVADAAPGYLDVPSLVTDFGFRDEQQALVIAYHELMWDVMDRLVALELVRKPVAFAEPDKTEAADIADLVFIVRTPS